jgi:hypothetical protein
MFRRFRSPRRTSSLEVLETRHLTAVTAQPTAADQLFLEELNSARANPAAYGASIGVDLSGVAPSQPLAFDPILINEAQSHALDMISQNYFSDTTPQGVTFIQRILNSGFPIKNRRFPDPWARGPIQQIYYTGFGAPDASPQTIADNVPLALSDLITDQGIANLHHRKSLLSTDQDLSPLLRLIGIGSAASSVSGVTTVDYSIDIAAPAEKDAYLTGVVFTNANGSGAYAIGEGLAGVTITATGNRGHASTTTFASGGYSLPLRAGTYTVTASGAGLPQPMSQTATMDSLKNVGLNFIVPV